MQIKGNSTFLLKSQKQKIHKSISDLSPGHINTTYNLIMPDENKTRGKIFLTSAQPMFFSWVLLRCHESKNCKNSNEKKKL